MINQQFRIQKFNKAIPAAGSAINDLLALSTIQANISGAEYPSTLGSLWNLISESNSTFEGVSFNSLCDQGKELDSSAFDGLAFKEGKSLLFDPKQEAVAAE